MILEIFLISSMLLFFSLIWATLKIINEMVNDEG